MNRDELVKYWKTEEQRSFQGWDFSSINNKTEEEDIKWSYKNIIERYLEDDYSLLDMGTGGGEFLLTLNHPFELTSVTEGYLPNYQLCLKVLKPKGITVKKVDEDDQLPFESETFDLIINRHESFCLEEIKRILKPGGLFITQQVGNEDVVDLSRIVLNNPDYINAGVNNYGEYLKEATELEFEIVFSDECNPLIKFKDVGTLVYFAKIIEWQFPGFSVDKNIDALERIHQMILKNGYVSGKQHRIIMVLRKV